MDSDRAMQVTHLFAGLAVSDFTVACDWYESLFDSPPDSFPKEGEAIWHPAPHASIYITADSERAGDGLLTLAHLRGRSPLGEPLPKETLAPADGPEHDHIGNDQEEVYAVVAGGGVLRTGGEEIPLRAGHFVYLPPEVRRQMVASDQGLTWIGIGSAT